MSGLIKYCPKCHQEAYRLIEEGENIKVILPNRKRVLNIGQKSSVNISLSCPSNHAVKLEIKGNGTGE